MLKLALFISIFTSQFWLTLIVMVIGLFLIGRKREWAGTFQLSELFVSALGSLFIALTNQG